MDGTFPTDLDPVDELAEEYLTRRRRGERPTPAEYAAQYPEHAERILALFPALELLEGLKPFADDHSGLSNDWLANRESSGGGPRRLGDYTLLRELGRGGMGIVYEAEHQSLKNRVALKVMHPRFRADRAYVRRFQTEARSAAKLHHTNIVPVFDYGEQDGVCYYAMQSIVGIGLDRVLEDVRRLRAAADRDVSALFGASANGAAVDTVADPLLALTGRLLTGTFANAPMAAVDGPATPRTTSLNPRSPGAAATGEPGAAIGPSGGSLDRSSFASQPESIYFREIARLGAQVADALDYAHRQGVVHRDIKPSNLLLDNQGNVWVTDFGLAKLLEGEDLSRSHDVVGTLRFIAPERFRGVTNPLGDVYSLGAALYELLTLQPAFPEQDQVRLIEQIAHQPAVPLRQHDHRIPRDLETLVQKALAKDPKGRFARAGDLGDELRRYLESRPIKSRPISGAERAWRWCLRNRWIAGMAGVAATAIVVLAIGATMAAFTFRGQRDRIGHADRKTRENLFESLTAQAQARRFSRRIGQRFESLRALARAAEIARELKLPRDRFDELRDEAIACLALPDMEKKGRVIHRPPGVVMATFDPTMTRYALRFRDGSVQIKNVEDDREVARFQAEGDREIFVFAFSPDGRYLATTHIPGFALTVWDIDRGAVVVKDPGPVAWAAARFSPNSRRIILAHPNGEIVIYDLETRRTRRLQSGLQGVPQDLAFRPDGLQIAVTNSDAKQPTCRILELESGRVVQTLALPSPASVAWSPDGTTLATPSGDTNIYLWDARSGNLKARLEGSTNAGLHATFLPAGKLLVSNGWENRLRLWDAAQGRPVLSVSGSVVLGFGFSHDGRIVVSRDDELTPYQVEPALEYRTLVHVSNKLMNDYLPAVSGDNRLMAVSSNAGGVFWDLARGAELAHLPIGNVWHVIFEQSGDLLTSGTIGVWRWPVQLDSDRTELRIGPPRRLSFSPLSGTIAEDRLGQIVAMANRTRADVQISGRLTRIGPLDDCRSVAVSPDGEWLATGSHQRGAQVWRIQDKKKVAELAIDSRTRVAFSPDGKWLMTDAPPCTLWAAGTWGLARELGGTGLCFSPDSRLVALVDASQVVRLVEAQSGRVIARLEGPESPDDNSAAFSPDGSRLVLVTNHKPAVHVWDLRAIRRRLVELGLDWDGPAYSDHDPAASSAPPLPPIHVNLGPLTGELEHLTEAPETLVARYSTRLKENPADGDARHHRGHALSQLRRFAEAVDDFTVAVRLRPDDAHLQEDLAISCNNQAWELATGPRPARDPERALTLARRAVGLAPNEDIYMNTLGVVQYRAGQHAQAIVTLERSLATGGGELDAFDLFFLAMAHHRSGDRERARTCFDRAVRWLGERKNLPDQYARELTAFRAEAEAVLAGPCALLPDNVFAPSRPGK